MGDNTPTMKDYLVFEAGEDYAGSPSYAIVEQGGRRYEQMTHPGTPGVPIPYSAVAAVRATDPAKAVQAVMGATRRIGKYAVIEAVFIDFSAALEEPEGMSPQLNP